MIGSGENEGALILGRLANNSPVSLSAAVDLPKSTKMNWRWKIGRIDLRGKAFVAQRIISIRRTADFIHQVRFRFMAKQLSARRLKACRIHHRRVLRKKPLLRCGSACRVSTPAASSEPGREYLADG